MLAQTCPRADRGSKRDHFDVPPYALRHVRIVLEPVVQLIARLEVAQDTRADHSSCGVEHRTSDEDLAPVDVRLNERKMRVSNAGSPGGRLGVLTVASDDHELHGHC
jgi:hypothetical protein